MADITKMFAATVKSVKTRRKDLSNLLPGKKCDASDQVTNKKAGKESNMDRFQKNAQDLLSGIHDLKSFLLEHQRDYLGGIGITGSSSYMSEEERDQIDQDAQTLMQSCSSAILHLKREINSSNKSLQVIQHQEGVLQLLNDYLKDVCKLYSQQRAIRVKRIVDRKRMARLKPQTDKEGTKAHSNFLKGIGNKREKLQSEHVEKDTNKDGSHTTNKIHLEEERSLNDKQEFSQEETQMFDKENERLYEEMNHLVNEVRQIEGKVIEISQLQEVFSEKVLHQSSQIEKIHESAISTSEKVKEGNENIREAIKNSATFRVWILFFLVMCTFSLLFLDWYNP